MLNNIYKIAWITCLCFLSTSLMAQLASYRTHKKIKDDQLYVRWEALNPDVFRAGLEAGYQIQLYEVQPSADSLISTLIEEQEIKALDYATWSQQALPTIWDSILLDLVYPDQLNADQKEERYPSDDMSANDYKLFLSNMANYCMNFDFDLIQKAGFGYQKSLDPTINRYALKIYLSINTGTVDTIWIDLDAANYRPPSPAPLEAEFKDSRVELKWRTQELRRVFFGYQIERSTDGNTWRTITEDPIVNPYDSIGAAEFFKYAYWTDTFTQNNIEVTYRLRGLDYLGDLSETYTEVSGSGYDEIDYSPAIYETVQTDSNYAIIKWDFDADYEPLLREFQILHTDTLGGIYQPILVNIDPSAREASLKMQFRSNFYRVLAVPFRGPAKTSFESLVMCYDEDPPAQPQGLEGSIDSNGIIRLKWLRNTEEDLGGYRVFKSYFKDEEFAGITPTPLQETSFIDTVDMETSNEWVYYQIQANDIRGNRSVFTNILALKKVDIIPPPPPRIHRAEEDGQSIEIAWYSSPAIDLERQRLFRRILGEEDNWTLIAEFAKDDPAGNSYQDQDVQLGPSYAYTLTAIDDDGLESEPAQAAVLKLTDYGIRPAIRDFRLQQLEDPTAIQLDWDYAETAEEFWLYKAKGEEELSLLKVIEGNARSYIDETVSKDQNYRYVLRAFFSGGTHSPFTEVLDITVN